MRPRIDWALVALIGCGAVPTGALAFGIACQVQTSANGPDECRLSNDWTFASGERVVVERCFTWGTESTRPRIVARGARVLADGRTIRPTSW